ncbi:MAG: TolC family outer membrane protein [Propionivibrio sp.]
MSNVIRVRIALLIATLFSTPLVAQEAPPVVAQQAESELRESTVASMKEAAQQAVLKSPEVLSRWHAFREAEEEIGVARGGFLPRVDLSAGSGQQKRNQSDLNIDQSYYGNESTLSLRQMLFDGFATSNEVKRLGRAKLVRYFELLDASENVALEAARAYLDVARFRAQVALAEDNYIQHQAAHEQLKKRAQSGVGKRVDVDQAASRLALADVNLTTAYANLHDVTARYVRIVGQPPAKDLPPPTQLAQSFPTNADAALGVALKNNPALRASIENIEASQYDLDARRAAFMPKFDLVARRDDYSNYEDAGSRDETRVEVRMNFNLFNGGSDAARSRQYRERKNVALDLREKACRDLRQTLAIAYNETQRLNDQLSYIALQVALVEKTRTAYRDQFNIGQRTLLDLLNTQNEYFDARRSQVNAEADLSIAYLRSYAGMGNLLERLGLQRVDADNLPSDDELTPVNLAQMCPPTLPADTTLDREALNRKAHELLDGKSGSFLGARSPAPAADAPSPAPVKATVETVEAQITARTSAWAAAWASRKVGDYIDFYSADFVPEGGLAREAWLRQREQRIARAQQISVEIRNPQVLSEAPDSAIVTFRQLYSADARTDTSEKTIEWRKEGGQWRIIREQSRTVAQGQ